MHLIKLWVQLEGLVAVRDRVLEATELMQQRGATNELIKFVKKRKQESRDSIPVIVGADVPRAAFDGGLVRRQRLL